MNPELVSWGLPIFIGLALAALSYNAQQVATRAADYRMAQLWFALAVLVPFLRVFYWALTASPRQSIRVVVCAVVALLLGLTAVEAFRSISSKRHDWIVAHSKPPFPKPIFKVTAPTMFTGLLNLDINLFRRVSGPSVNEGLFPVILTLENLPDLGFPENEPVSAQLIYRQYGMELERVNLGCWVDQALPNITFPFSTLRYLIVGGWHTKGRNPLKDEFRIVEYSRDLHRAIIQPNKMSAPRGLVVEVILIPQNAPMENQHYRFILELLSPGFFKFYELTPEIEEAAKAGKKKATVTPSLLDELGALRDEGNRIFNKLLEHRVTVPYEQQFEDWKATVQKYLDHASPGYATRFRSETLEYPCPRTASARTRPLVDRFYTRIMRLEEFIKERSR